MEKTRFTCALCHGTFSIDDQGKRVKIKDGGIFGPPEHMLLHKAWLRGMKEEFLKKRKEILRITLPCKDEGEWIQVVMLLACFRLQVSCYKPVNE